MTAVCYEFDKISNLGQNNYIFQYIHGRKLSNILHYHDFYEALYIADGECEQEVNSEKFL